MRKVLLVAVAIAVIGVFAATREAYAPEMCPWNCLYNWGVCICDEDPPTNPCPACETGPIGDPAIPIAHSHCYKDAENHWQCGNSALNTCCFCSYYECNTLYGV